MAMSMSSKINEDMNRKEPTKDNRGEGNNGRGDNTYRGEWKPSDNDKSNDRRYG